MMIRTQLVALVTLSAFLSTSCGGRAAPTAPAPVSDQVLVQSKDLPDGLDLHLSNGKQGAPAYDRARLAPARKLADADASALLSRARPIAADPADRQAFALRPASQPPPRTGEVMKSTFPPPAASLLPPATGETGALRVARFMPEGKVPLAPELSVTFSQPMVAVTSQDDAAKTTPVQLTPTPKGHWRWIGTRTILFDPEGRFPQATTYTVEVPAGTRSATGGALAKATTFRFETPPPSLVASYPDPDAPQRLDVPMLARFDQRIDPAAVLAHAKVLVDGTPFPTRLLDAAELAKDKPLAALAADPEQAGRWLAFRATQAFPPAATITVELGAGTPSAEGPNPTTVAQRFSFHTYPPLRVVEARCGYGDECRPGMAFAIQLTNPLDADRFDEAALQIEPALPDAHVIVSGTAIVIQGSTTAHTRYRVTVPAALTDVFGQTLGHDSAQTFDVGGAQPSFFGPSGMVVLDPAARRPTLDFFSTNYPQLKVRLYQVAPSDFDAYAFLVANQWNHDKPPPVPGKLVFDRMVKTRPGPDQLVETSVDLASALGPRGLGHALAIVEPSPWTERYEPPRMIAWVQATRLAVDAHLDGDNLIAFVTELATGKPAAGVQLAMAPTAITGTTDAAGLATLGLPAGSRPGRNALIARRGDDVAMLVDGNGWYGDRSTWTREARAGTLAWYVTDDRRIYKPGEDVALKGWLRELGLGKGGDLAGVAGRVTEVTYKLFDSRNNQLATGKAPVSPVGGFDAKITLPRTPNLGAARIELEARGMGGTYQHRIQIEEFRRPEFEVSADASQGPFVVGGSGDVTVHAKYFAGGPLAGAPVEWNVLAADTVFTPPGRDDYTFGMWRPWWGYQGWDSRDRGGNGRRAWQWTDKTDATGAHALHLDFLSLKPALPMALTASASVTDVNRQTWSASAPLIVHPATRYVGVKLARPFVVQGAPLDVRVIGVDLDGKPAIGAPIELRSVRLDWEYKRGQVTTKEVEPQTCAVTAARDASACTFQTQKGGTYKLTATIVDDRGRPNQTELTYWVSGGDRPPARDVEREQVQIIPDRQDYAPGTTAELLVQAPFYPAEGLVTWRRSGIVKTERITVAGPTQVVKVPITDAMTPNLIVQVDLVGAAPRVDDRGVPDPKLPSRPAYAVGQIDLPIPPRQRTLAVTATPSAAKLGPGEALAVALAVRDAAGKPVANAEAAVIVVDEAILALTAAQFANPIDSFYPHRGEDARDLYARGYVKLARPSADQLAQANNKSGRVMTRSAPGGGGAVEGAPPPAPPPPPMAAPAEALADVSDSSARRQAPQPAIAIRSDFNPLAAFAPAVRTDAAGRATVQVKLPDNLTRYRVVAIAVAGDKQFGKGEGAVTARLPLMVRPSPPRFLNFGDTFQLPVVVQNQTDAAMTVRLAVRATNAALTDGAGREVSVPANDRVEVRFPAAAEMAGTARFQIVGTAGARSDAAELALPVWTPATTEAFATYGVIDHGATAQPVALPDQVVPQFGGLDVTTASTNLQALTDAMLYLVHYPFECAEQRSSRILAIAALKDVLAAFQVKDMPSAAAMTTSVAADLERLSQMQNSDGGFAFWDRGYPSEPYLTVYVASALGHAQQKGFAVKPGILERAKAYLRDIEGHYPSHYGKEIRWTISAYALYTRKQLGELDLAKAKRLVAEAGVAKLSMEANGWLLATLAGNAGAVAERKAIVRLAMNKVSETAGAANFTTSYGDGKYLLLASDHRVDAVMLDALIQEQQDLDLIPKLVTGLLAHRKAGRWLNTQENTFALLALDRYFQTYEKTTPDFVARVWLGKDYAGDHAFKGRTTETAAVHIAMKDVVTHDQQALTIQKDGAGRLYYRIGMTYAPASLTLEPADRGFVVERRYEAVDDPQDVTRAADGVWHIKAGARVRVRLTMVNENRRYHVALVDPLPAGLETLNPALATTGPIPQDPGAQQERGAYWWWYGPWYEHQNLRDERVEAFAALLWEGVHKYDYVARATTPGRFVVPPPKAEEMYMPETFGRGATDRVVIE
jgi:uncharacterized protein YfaS (alpha-2-macroglobulin family)